MSHFFKATPNQDLKHSFQSLTNRDNVLRRSLRSDIRHGTIANARYFYTESAFSLALRDNRAPYSTPFADCTNTSFLLP